jgi:hypothetical protein
MEVSAQSSWPEAMESSLAALKLVLDDLDVALDVSAIYRRKTIQKAIYLAQRAGVDLGYRFGWYIRGPYSPPLATAYYGLAEALASDEAIGPRELRSDLRNRLKAIRPLMDVPSGLSLHQADWLELLASLHYLLTIRNQDLEKATTTLQKEKPNLAPYVAQANQALGTHGLI